MPRPVVVAKTIFSFSLTKMFWLSIANTFYKILTGFALAIGTGICLAFLCYYKQIFYEIAMPILSLFKSTPVASITILCLVWIKSSSLSILIAFIMVMPMIFFNTYIGLQSIDKKLLELVQVFDFSIYKKFRVLYMPSILPYIVSSASAALGYAWKSGIAAEVIALPNNTIGINLYNSKISLDTKHVFAWTIVVILLSYIMEKWFIKIINRVS